MMKEMRGRKGIKKLVSLAVAFVALLTTVLGSSVVANAATYTGYSEFVSGKTYAYPLYVNADGKKQVAYCFNATKAWPDTPGSSSTNFTGRVVGATEAEFASYSYTQVANKKDNVLKTVYYGYPYNKGGIKEKYGLTAMQFRAVTQAVIWWWTDKEDLEDGAQNKLYYGSKYNLTHVSQYVYDSQGRIVFDSNGNPKFTTTKVFEWTNAMTNAYYELRNNGSYTYPDTFELDLYRNSDSGFQNLLSTRLTEEEAEKPSVKISKVKLGGTNVAGASIQILDSQKKVVHQYTSSNTAESLTIDPGTYTFHEVSAPNGYKAVTDFNFTVSNTGVITLNSVDSNVASVVNGVLVVTDKYKDQSVEVSKTDVGGKELPGASMELTGTTVEGTKIEAIKWTSGTETKKVSVQPGTYTLTEKTAPKGYEVAESITFKVSLDSRGNTLVTVNGTDVNGKVTMKDKYSDQSVEISKTDVGGKELPGASMEVTGKAADGTTIAPIKWTSGTETKKINVQPGTYTLTETTAPKGYAVAESITFKVALDKDGNAVVTVKGDDVKGKVTMEDKYSGQTVEISKTDVGGKELPGAVLEVTGQTTEGTEIEPIKWTSGTQAKKISVQPGTYSLTEKTAPNGYEVAESVTFKVELDKDGNAVVTVNGDDVKGKVTMKDKYSNQTVEISKTDVGGKELPGAAMEVTGTTAEGTEIEAIKWISGTETKKISVQPGTYTLTEKTAPKGYEVAESITFKVALDKDGNTVVTVNGDDVKGKVTMKDKYSDQSVEISKTDIGGKELPGASMEVTGKAADGTEIEPIKWTSGTETKKISLQPGTYTLTEKTAPKGYEVAESITFKVTVDETGNAVVTVKGDDVKGKVTMEDKYSGQSVEISKTDIGGKELPGASMEVTGTTAEGTEIEAIKWTSGTETKKISLQPGTYTLTEKTAPKGYEVAESITFKVDLDKDGNAVVTVKGDDVKGKVTMKDKYSDQSVEISKTDIGGKELPGASMEVTGKTAEGTEIEPIKWTSGTETKKISVQPGTYTLTEKTAPKGYEVAESITFKVTLDKDGNTVVTVKGDDVKGKVTMKDKYSDQSVEISKTDVGGKELPGASMEVTGKTAEGAEIEPIKWTSGTETKKISLQPGTYTLTEKTAPKGYEVAESITFKVAVDENGNAVVTVKGDDVDGKVTMEDKYTDQTVEISKTDVAGDELEGASMEVTGKTAEGTEIKPIKWTSGTETKKITVQPGTYTLTEKTAPKGYEVAESITFKVALDKDGNAVVTVKGDDVKGKVTMKDKYSDQSVEISKTDIGGEELPGASMEVTGTTAEGTEIEAIKWTSGTETKKISVQPGTYTLTEKTAPKGYEVAESITFKVALDNDGNAVVTVGGDDVDGKVTMEDKYSDQELEISKTDVGGKELPGASMEVTGKTVGGTEIEPIKWTSGTETKKISLQPGTYTLTEKTAPKGYEVAESITFKVALDKDGNTLVTVGDENVNGKVTMEDKYTDQTVEISKTDVAGDELEGASMEVTGKTAEGTEIEPIKWTSGTETKKITVQPGTYTLTEKTAPKGYEVAESITFKVALDKNGNAVVTVNGNDVKGKVTMVDKYSDQTVGISKVNLGGNEIGGARIVIKDKDGKVVDRWTSKKGKTHKISVQPGTYTFHEEAAPEGYKAVTDIKFSVDHNGKVTVENKNGNTVKVDAETGNLVVTDQYADKKTVKTGDNTTMLLYVVMLISSLMGIGGLAVFRRN